jgi:hypothetical protein
MMPIYVTCFVKQILAEISADDANRAKWKGKDVALKVFDKDHISFSIEEFRKELALLW